MIHALFEHAKQSSHVKGPKATKAQVSPINRVNHSSIARTCFRDRSGLRLNLRVLIMTASLMVMILYLPRNRKQRVVVLDDGKQRLVTNVEVALLHLAPLASPP